MKLNDLKSDKIEPGNKEVVHYVDRLFNKTKSHYLRQQRDWYINERFVRGDHWIVFNKSLNKVQVIPITEGEIRRTVNKVRAQIRGVKNFIKKSQPRWEVHPTTLDNDQAIEFAIQKNKILQHLYRKHKIPHLLTGVIINGLKYSLGLLEGAIVKKGGKDTLDFWVDDTFDIFFDPLATSIDNCRFYIKAIRKPISTIESNKNYTIKKPLVGEGNMGAVHYKDLLELEKYGRDKVASDGDLEGSLVKELWMKWEEDGKTKIKVHTVTCGQHVRVWNPKYRRYPLFGYNPEMETNAIYSDAWVKDLISPNKSLDKMASQVEGYIQRMLAGKYLIKQGVEVTSITDKGAEKIYYKGSTPPVQQNLQSLPSTPFQYMTDLERWIEEFGGIREASLGRTPGSVSSGKAIEALQQSDAQTVAEPIENLERMLQDVGEFILEVIEDHNIASEEIVEDGETIKYIGGNVVKKAGDEGQAMPIRASDVKVVIVPEISYSEEYKKEIIMRLAEAELIDPETLLERLSFSNVGDVIMRVKKMKEEKYKEEMMKQKESHRTEGQGPEDTADLADQENMEMAAGKQIPATPQALWSPEHLELHMAFIQENQDAYQQNEELFNSHIQQEEQYGNQEPQRGQQAQVQ